jgi:PAS domain S-box-containing protein
MSTSPSTPGRPVPTGDPNIRAIGEALDIERQKLAAIIRELPIGIATADPAGNTLSMNEAALRLHGFSSEEEMVRRLPQYLEQFELLTLDGAILPVEHWPVSKALRGESVHGYEVRVRNRTAGTERVVSYSAVPVKNHAGEIAVFVYVMEDITERKHADSALRAAHDTFRHLVEQSPFGVYAVDADFRLVQVSAGAQRVFETVRPLLGRDFADVLRTIWPEPFATEAIGRFRHTLDTGEAYHAPSTVERRRDIGEVESYDWKIERVTLPDGRFGVVCHFYDLSERQRYEAALRDADRRKSEFLAVLSHELRNPLAPIRTGIYLLEHAGAGSEQAARARDVIRRQTDHLTRLVDDLLDVTRISHGKIQLRRERLDLRDIVRRTSDDLRSNFEHSGLTLRVEHGRDPVWIDADRTRIAQVLGNLLQNSLKFTPAGGIVTVRVGVEDGRATLRVQDTGVGIEPEQVHRVFDAFTQTEDGLARTKGGLGLGLSLVKGLIELHGGAVRAHSEGLGRGTEMVVSLPSADATRTDAGLAVTPAPAVTRLVLIVEDNVDAGQMLAEMLSLHGHTVRVARNATTALRLAREIRPDVILCDIGLPDLDGYEVARVLRREPGLATTRLIALSGYSQPEDRRQAHEAGFDAHLAKPPDPDELLAAIGDVA